MVRLACLPLSEGRRKNNQGFITCTAITGFSLLSLSVPLSVMAKKLASEKKTRKTVSKPCGLSLTDLPGTIAFTLDKKYCYVSFSPLHAQIMKKIWGVEIELGFNMLDYISRKLDRIKAKRNFDSALKGKHFSKTEQYGDPGHQRTTYQDHYGPVLNKSGRVVGLYVWVLDLTAHKRTESEAIQNNSILTSSLESIDHGILIVDKQARVIFRNQKFLDIWEFPPVLLQEKNDLKLLAYAQEQMANPQLVRQKIDFLYQNIELESTDHIELRDRRILRRYTRPHYLEKEIIGRVWSFRDVTHEFQQRKTLEEWKNRHQLIVSSFGRVVYDYDVNTGAIIWSGNISEILGYGGHEMGDINQWSEHIHIDDQPEAFRLLEEAQARAGKYETTYRFNTKHFGYRWLKDIGFFIADPDGKSVRMVGEMTDISQQIEADREIRHLASFPFHNPEVVFEIKPDGSLSYGNPAFFETIRRLGLKDHNAFVVAEADVRKMAGTPWKTTAELIVNGRTFNEKIFYLPEKNLIRVYAFDLTDRLEAERQKTDLEHTYQNLFESASDSIMLLDVEENPGKITSANPASATLYGYTLPELLSMNIKDLDVITSSNQITFEERTQLIAKEKRQIFEVTHKKKDGTIFPLEVIASRFDVSGKRLELVFMRDITSRKKNEEEIRMQYKFIESLSSASPNVIYVYDVDEQKYVYGNQRMAEAYGYSLDQLLQHGPSLILANLHPEDAIQATERMNTIFQAQDGEVLESRFRLKGKDGNWRTFHTRGAVLLRKSDGSVKQYIGTSIDISKQVEAEEALRESEQRFRALNEASFGGIGIHDMGKIIECNAGLSRLTGYSQEELIGMNGWDLIHPDDHAFVLEKVKSDYEIPYDVRGVRKDGSVYALEIVGKNIPYQGKEMRVTELRDITERVNITEKIKEQNIRLQSIAESLRFKNQQLDEFTQIVSHNLRAPAGNIVSLSNFLAEEKDPHEQAKIFDLLKLSGSNILTTLSELNEVLKIKQNKNIEKQLLRFADVYEKACQMLNAQITSTHATLSVNFSEVNEIEYPHIYLESIFLNLVSNSLKYYDPQRPLQIFIKTTWLEGRTCLEVTDTGLGINMERYGHQIFKMRKTFHNHPDSRGIGLFMIKNQIEAMGGKISITSTVGQGTTFRVIF